MSGCITRGRIQASPERRLTAGFARRWSAHSIPRRCGQAGHAGGAQRTARATLTRAFSGRHLSLCSRCPRWHFLVRLHAARGATKDENEAVAPRGTERGIHSAVRVGRRVVRNEFRAPAQSVFHPCFIRGQIHFQVTRMDGSAFPLPGRRNPISELTGDARRRRAYANRRPLPPRSLLSVGAMSSPDLPCVQGLEHTGGQPPGGELRLIWAGALAQDFSPGTRPAMEPEA